MSTTEIPQEIKKMALEFKGLYPHAKSDEISAYVEGAQDGYSLSQQERDELRKEVAELKAWKQEALSVMPDYQAIGNALNIRLGESIHDKILPGIERLKGLIDLAYGAGYNRRCSETDNHETVFGQILATKTTSSLEQFKQQNKL